MMDAPTTEKDPFDVSDKIVAFKRQMAPRRAALHKAFGEVTDHVKREADRIQADAAAGRQVVPEVPYADIRDGKVSEATKAAIRRTGCAVVRGVYPETMASDWFAEVGAYLDDNRYEEKEIEKRSLDKYFSALKAGKPQIFNVYWSKPQVNARQGESLAATRAFLDRLWKYEGVFDPDLQCTYADRVRRRQPGDKTLGLSPHMDAGTVERWIDPGYQRVYERVFAGDWRGYNPFDGKHRLETEEIPSPAVASVFRTYQGWTALTRQGPKDGTLRLIPIAEGISYVLLRALEEDVPEDQLCGAAPGRALGVSPEWHPDLLAAQVSIPEVMPGDTVWWHTDICHAVADEHTGKEYASVIYIGSAPDCPKNRAYLPRQREAFLSGRSAPDFAPMDFEVDFKGRATLDDLTPLGRKQMGF
jgi:hypothetical protein